MRKRILFIHGRDFKPDKEDLRELWYDATQSAIEKFFPEKLEAYKDAIKQFAYYGGISNKYLFKQCKGPYDKLKDMIHRRETLRLLEEREANQFERQDYRALPGKSSLYETIADIVSGPFQRLKLSKCLIGRFAPDMGEYWNSDAAFGSEVRWKFTVKLREAFDSGDEVLVISHSLGTVIAWDTFWKFSYYGEYQNYREKQIDLFITLGSPLADGTMQRQLKGARAKGERRFPINIKRWENIAAEDDYVAHDETMRNNYKQMTETPIQDHRIYNLGIYDGKSKPHNSIGYLYHPKTAELIANWL